MKQACAYVRVSTDEQVELSPTSQRNMIYDYCKKNGYLIADTDIYEDLGISGKSADRRPGFRQMIAMCKSKEHPYDAIIVWKFSRFARNQEESIVYKSMLRKIGVEVISISEPISEGLGGKLTEAILEIMDEYYSINLSQEVMRGMKQGASEGKRMSIAPYGYITKDGKLIPDETESEIVRYIFEGFVNGGFGISSMALELNSKGIKTKKGNAWENRGIKYILENPVYIGKVRWNYCTHDGHPGTTRRNDSSEWIIVDGHHEPLIDTELFEAAAKKLQSLAANATVPSKSKTPTKHWLSGTLKCKYCGYGMSYNSGSEKNHTKPFFLCQGNVRGKCAHKQSRKAETIEQEFFAGLQYAIDSEQFVFAEKPVQINSPQIAELTKQLNSLDKKLIRAKQAYLSEIDTLEEYSANKRLIESERELLTKRLLDAKNGQNEPDILFISERIQNVMEILKSDSYNIAQKNEALKTVVNKVIYSKEDDTMEFFFNM